MSKPQEFQRRVAELKNKCPPQFAIELQELFELVGEIAVEARIRGRLDAYKEVKALVDKKILEQIT